MKYYKHFEIVDGVVHVNYFQPEDTNISIPEAPDNMDYARMMEEVDAGTSTIEEVDDSIVLTYADKRRAAYPDIGDQLDDLYHQATFSDEMAAKLKAVKDANPKG